MSETLEALLLGIVQGLTEFLPVSSSGHLEIMKFILGDDSLPKESLMTSVVLHFATAVATVMVFRKEVLQILTGLFKNDFRARTFSVHIIISMIPAAIVGFFFEDIIDQLFYQAIFFVALMLIVTGLILLLSEKIKVQSQKLTFKSAFCIGLAQAVALIPGISRSGATIGTALLLGIEKTSAARFSFLMVVPLIFGKVAKDVVSGELMYSAPSAGYLLTGFVAAFITGVIACQWMIRIVKNAKLKYFAYYCFTVSILVISYLFIIQ